MGFFTVIMISDSLKLTKNIVSTHKLKRADVYSVDVSLRIFEITLRDPTFDSEGVGVFSVRRLQSNRCIHGKHKTLRLVGATC